MHMYLTITVYILGKIVCIFTNFLKHKNIIHEVLKLHRYNGMQKCTKHFTYIMYQNLPVYDIYYMYI